MATFVSSRWMKTICHACGAVTSSDTDTCEVCGLPVAGGFSDATLPPASEGAAGTTTELSATATKQADTEDETAPATVTLASTRFLHKSPLQLAIHFPGVLMAGCPSRLQLQIRNLTPQPLKHVKLRLHSRGLKAAAAAQIELLAPQQPTVCPFQVEPSRAGVFILWCEVLLKVRDQCQHLTARRLLAINARPADEASLPDARDLHTNHAVSDESLAVQGFRDSPLSNYPEAAEVKSLSDLLAFPLPERYQALSLTEDWHLSLPVANALTAPQSRRLIIPRQFRRYVQPGRLLRLIPAEAGAARELHLVARNTFHIGRSRKRADLVTWFHPPSAINDDRTQHLSKVHVVCKCEDGRLFVQDAESKCGTFFEGEKMPPLEWFPLEGRSLIALADEYFLEAQPLDTACPDGPEIINLSLWPGPTEPRPARQGAVRFLPADMELAHHNAIWMFTDVTFGRSRSNGVVFELEGIEPVQGRFHHHRGCFWLENLVANFALHVNGIVLNAREIIPLMDGLDLKVGNVNFRVEVLA